MNPVVGVQTQALVQKSKTRSTGFVKIQKEYDLLKAWGLVASVDVYGCNREIISHRERIKEFIIKLVDHIGMVRYGPAMIERFAEGSLEGFSALQFIETSSITMHFDEQKNRAFIDVFSCKCFDPEAAQNFCQEYLEGSHAKTRHFFRC